MSKIRQILRLYTHKKGTKFISKQTGVARNTVKKYIIKFNELKISMSEIDGLDDYGLNELFGKSTLKIPEESYKYKQLKNHFPYVEKELKKPGVTLEMLWFEYVNLYPEGYRRSQFGHLYRQWIKRSNPSMHIHHKAGNKMYVDYAGSKLKIVDPDTGELLEKEVFVAILGASQLTYVEVVDSQQKADFIMACENALHYFQGVPGAIVPDNLKAAVTKSNRYEPTINETFADFALHYDTDILPARAYRPKDKALVEGAVKIIYTRIYAALRKNTYHTLESLNEDVWKQLELHNDAPLKGREYSRRSQFNDIEKEALKPLPKLRYELKQQLMVTVPKNNYVCLTPDKHYYSVPYQFIGKRVKIIFSKSQVDIYYDYNLIATHKRTKSPYNHTTITDHLASAHKFVNDWNPERFITWGESIGQETKLMIINILKKKQHPEQAYKSCLGVLGMAKKVGNERLNNACKRALTFNTYHYMAVQNILIKGLDKLEDESGGDLFNMPKHDNIRGEDYYE